MPGARRAREFADEESGRPSIDHWWAFPVDPVSHRLEGNARAVFEAVAARPVDLQVGADGDRCSRRSPAPTWSADPIESVPGQYYLLRPGTIFVTRGPRTDVNHPLSGRRHRFVGLRRGTPLAGLRGGRAPSRRRGRSRAARRRLHDNDLTSAVVPSSEADRAAMSRPCVRAVASLVGDRLAADRPAAGRRRRAARATSAAGCPPRRRARGPAPRAVAPGRAAGRRAGAPPGLRRPGLAASVARDARAPCSGCDRPSPGPGRRTRPIDGVGRAPRRRRSRPLGASLLPDVEVVLRATAAAGLRLHRRAGRLPGDRPARGLLRPGPRRLRPLPGLLHDLDDVVPGRCAATAGLRAAWSGCSSSRAPAHAAEYERRRARAAPARRRTQRRPRGAAGQATYLPIEEWLAEAA